MGRLADRFGVMVPLLIGGASPRRWASPSRRTATSIWQFTLAHGAADRPVGSSATFAPLIADTSLWFDAPPRHRGRDLRERQLSRRRDLAAGRAAFRRDRRLARDVSRHRRSSASSRCCRSRLLMRRPPAAARVDAPAARAPRGIASGRSACRRRALQALLVHRRPRAAASRCRCRRSTSSRIAATWATARRAARRCCRSCSASASSSRLVSGCDLRSHRRAAHAAARLGAAGRRAAAVPAVRRARVAVRDLGAVRPVPGRHRAVVRDHRPRALPAAARRARASGVVIMCHAVRHGARRLDVGQDVRPDRVVPRGVRQRHRVERARTCRSPPFLLSHSAAGASCDPDVAHPVVSGRPEDTLQ